VQPLMTVQPCPRCLKLAVDGVIEGEMVQPLPDGVFAPHSRDREHPGSCCFDCASADGLTGFIHPDFTACRIAVGNERSEHLRLPAGVRMGLVKQGLVRADPSGPEAFQKHLRWLDAHVWPMVPRVQTED
jgi:hypothetical protein